MADMSTPTFAPPGPGTWEMDDQHFWQPAYGPLMDVFPEAFTEGMRRCMKAYGMLVDTIDVRFVNGFPYQQLKIVGAPAPSDGKPPPAWLFGLVFRALVRVHPELRRRTASQRDLFVRRPWRAAVARWERELKPATIAKHAAIDAVDVAGLDEVALAAHARRARAHAVATLTQDHEMNMDALLPVGDYLAQVGAWTGAPAAELLRLLRGSSAVSAGDTPERRAVVDAVRADAAARALLESGRPAREVWDGLLADQGAVGAAMREMRVIWGNSIVHGLDVETPTVDEEPASLLAGLRAQVRGEAAAPALDDGAERALRERVPSSLRSELDEVLADARAVYRLRDERHLYGALPTVGIARRMYREAARRLAARSAIDDERHAFVATTEEIARLLSGFDPALSAELARRAQQKATLTADAAPRHLGPPPEPPPPAEWMPNEGARRAMRALNAVFAAMDDAPSQRTGITGLAVSRGVHVGTARVCATSADLTRVQQGDVLVARLTTPAINVVLPVLGAIVTDKGGALSHAAIVCREYGIPGVVGTKTATTAIPDGARVRVDGDAGVVTLL